MLRLFGIVFLLTVVALFLKIRPTLSDTISLFCIAISVSLVTIAVGGYASALLILVGIVIHIVISFCLGYGIHLQLESNREEIRRKRKENRDAQNIVYIRNYRDDFSDLLPYIC